MNHGSVYYVHQPAVFCMASRKAAGIEIKALDPFRLMSFIWC
jgi:hypothetical protein